MGALTIRNVPDEVHRALKARASEHGRSAEAEVREILASAVLPATRVRLGDALASLGRDLEMSDADVDALGTIADRRPAEPIELP